MVRYWLLFVWAVTFSSISIAGNPSDKPRSDLAGKCVMPREGAKYWMGGRETNQLLPLSLDVMAEDGEWLIVLGGKVKKADVIAADQATAYYHSLLKANPKDAWAMAMLGWYYISEDDFEKARPILDKALKMNSTNLDARLARGALYGCEEEPELAIKQFDQAIRIRPDCALAFYYRGFYKAESGDKEAAIADNEAAIKISPDYSLAYVGRGALYDNSELWKEALADFDKALSLDPYNDVALSRRAWIRSICPETTLRNGKLAIEDAKKACELSKYQDWEDLTVLAAAHAEAGHFDDAVKFQTKAVELAQGGRRFVLRLQLERYKQNKTYKFPPTEESDP